jgi:hypothetical protein
MPSTARALAGTRSASVRIDRKCHRIVTEMYRGMSQLTSKMLSADMSAEKLIPARPCTLQVFVTAMTQTSSADLVRAVQYVRMSTEHRRLGLYAPPPLEISALQEMDFDVGLLGFSSDELAETLRDSTEEGLTDSDDIPAPPDKRSPSQAIFGFSVTTDCCVVTVASRRTSTGS